MGTKVIIENTDANRNLEVFHNPDDGFAITITPGSRVGCLFTNEQELVIRRTNMTTELIPEPTAVDDADHELKGFIREE